MSEVDSIRLSETRFDRTSRIQWWDQSQLASARILVIGAGALGNEVLKNLALLGTGNIVVADLDVVELSNLNRSVLFRESDEGCSKAECAARAVIEIFPGTRVKALAGNVLCDFGLGYFRWAQIIVGAVDNREARVFINSACARVDRPWIDGGIEVLSGVVRGFHPPATACYECTMSQVDWNLLRHRRSCSLLARRAIELSHTPTTCTTASVVAAIEVQEVVKLLHGMDALLGRGFVFEGLHHGSYAVSYPLNPECPWHETASPIENRKDFDSSTPLRAVWKAGEGVLGEVDSICLAREIVEGLECINCNTVEQVLMPAEHLQADRILCQGCGGERSARLIHSLGKESELLDRSPSELGVPAWDVVWAIRGEQMFGFEFSGDRPAGLVAPDASECS